MILLAVYFFAASFSNTNMAAQQPSKTLMGSGAIRPVPSTTVAGRPVAAPLRVPSGLATPGRPDGMASAHSTQALKSVVPNALQFVPSGAAQADTVRRPFAPLAPIVDTPLDESEWAQIGALAELAGIFLVFL